MSRWVCGSLGDHVRRALQCIQTMKAYRRRETYCVVRKIAPDKPVVHEEPFEPSDKAEIDCDDVEEHHPACQV